MPFNQMMLFPVTLTLHATEEGTRMFAEPIREVASLHGDRRRGKNQTLTPGDNLALGLSDELVHLRADLRLVDASETGFVIRGVPVTYNAEKQELSCQNSKAPLKAMNGKIKLEILVDRTSIEIFGNNGRMYMPMGVILADNPKTLEIFTKGGNTEIESLTVFHLRSAWK